MIKNTFYNLAKNIATLLFPFLTYAYASRILLPQGMGQIDFAKSVSTLLTMIAMLGMRHYGVRECSNVKDDKKELSRTARELLTLNLLTTGVAYILLFVALIAFRKLRDYNSIILIYSFQAFLTVIGIEWLYTAMEDFKYLAVRTCLVQVVSLASVLVFVKDEGDVWKYAVINVVSTGGAYVLSFIHSRKYIDYKTKLALNISKHFKPILALFFVNAFIEVYVTLDTVMLGVMTQDVYVGYYDASYKMSSALCTMVLAFLQIFIPKIAYYSANGDRIHTDKLLGRAMSLTLMLDIPISVGMFMLSDSLILLLSGEKFAPAFSAGRVLAARLLIGPINFLLIYDLFIPLRKDNYAISVTLAAAVIDVVVNLFAIPVLKHTGAAISTVAAEAMIFVAGMILSRKIISFSDSFRSLWQYIVAAIPIVMVCKLISCLNLGIVFYLLLSFLISAIAYFAILYCLRNELVVEGVLYLKHRFIKSRQ